MTIYDRVRMLREQRNMSQEELAHAVGFKGRAAISKIENGERDISQSLIVSFSNALGTTPTYLLFGKEEKDEREIILEQLRQSPETRMLFDAAKGATAEQIKQAAEILKVLKGQK